MENRLVTTPHRDPGEALFEVSQLGMLDGSKVDADCLKLLSSPDEPPLAEYWFGSFEQAEHQVVTRFGVRFTELEEGSA